MYQFSAPMPYTKDDIQKLLDINNQIEKSRITSLYACVPRGCEVFTGFEQSRNFAFDNLSWDYWKRLINQTFDLNCDFIYLLNSPRPLDIENPDFPKKLDKLEILLTELKKIGVKKLRVASAQLMSYIAKHYSDFELLASTSLDYKTIWEYQNFIELHEEVKQIVLSHDVNKNFLLLNNLKTRYPKIEIELIVNEGCLQGCPHRMLHQMVNIDNDIKINDDICLSVGYAGNLCRRVAEKYPFQSLIISNNIFPWDIEEYKKAGINNFKFVGRDGFDSFNFNYILDSYIIYLKGIDNVKSIENYGINYLTLHLLFNPILSQLKIKEAIKYFPKIEYFKKYGYLCSSRCAYKCCYCYKCANKIQKVFVQKKHSVKSCKI